MGARIIFPLLLIAFFAPAQSASKLQDYAYQALLSENDQPLQRVSLPVEVLKNLTRADMSDLAVFNVDGKRLPHAVIATPDRVTERELELPFHEFDRFLKQRSKTVTTREQNRRDDAISESATTETLPVRSVRKVYLIELKPDQGGHKFERIELQWSHQPASQMLEVRVEAGDEIDRLRSIDSRKSLTNLESSDLEWRSIGGIPANNRYLRLTPINDVTAFELQKATGIYRETSPAPRLASPVELEISDEDEGRFYAFATPWKVGAEQMRIVPAQTDSVVSGDLYVTWSDNEQRSRALHRFRQHNLGQTGIKPSRPIRLPRRAYRKIWFTSSDNLETAPGVELIFQQYQAHFLGDGNGPYTLAWGNHEAQPQAADLNALLQKNLRDSRNHGAIVTPGAIHDSGGAARLAPRPALPWKQWLLWALLVLAALITGRMAYRLYREMNPKNT